MGFKDFLAIYLKMTVVYIYDPNLVITLPADVPKLPYSGNWKVRHIFFQVSPAFNDCMKLSRPAYMIDNVGGTSSVKSIIQRFNWNCKIADFKVMYQLRACCKNIELSSLNIFPSKTHCSLVMQYGDTDLGQHWLMKLLVAWWHQAITWTNTIKGILWYYSPERNFNVFMKSIH